MAGEAIPSTPEAGEKAGELEANGEPALKSVLWESEKIPKSVVRCRSYLASIGKPITAETMKLLPQDLQNLAGNLLRSRLNDAQKVKYKALENDHEKRQWLAMFLSDPKVGSKKGFNEHFAFDGVQNQKDEQWLLETQIASPQWLNSPELAKMLCASGELEEQPSQYKVFADMGLKEFKMSAAILRRLTGWQDKAGASSSSEIGAEEYEQIRDGIKRSMVEGGKPKQKATKKQKKEDTEDDKKLKATLKERGKSLQKLKSVCDKIHRELNEANLNIEKLKALVPTTI